MEQTEIDALLIPERSGTLEEIVHATIAPYYDATLERRCEDAKRAWQEEADAALDAALEDGAFSNLFAEAVQYRDALADVMQRMESATDRIEIDLPRLELPAAITGETPAPLVSSAIRLREAIRVLRQRKDYAAPDTR